MDGGVQLLGLAQDACRPVGPARAVDGTLDQLQQGRVQAPVDLMMPSVEPAGWASLLTARVKQAAGLNAPRPAAPGAEEGWVGRLKAHALRSSWNKVERAPAADPIATFATALNLLREMLDRERNRADAAVQGGQACIAAAEARAVVAERQLREVQAVLSRREGELVTAQGRLSIIEGHLASATRRAEQAEGKAKKAKSELRRLRSRGLWTRIFNAG